MGDASPRGAGTLPPPPKVAAALPRAPTASQRCTHSLSSSRPIKEADGEAKTDKTDRRPVARASLKPDRLRAPGTARCRCQVPGWRWWGRAGQRTRAPLAARPRFFFFSSRAWPSSSPSIYLVPGAPRAAGRGAEAKPGGQEFESRHLRTRVREELEGLEERGERAGVCASAGCPGPRRRHRLRREGKGEPWGAGWRLDRASVTS